MSNNFNEWLDELENDQNIQIDETRREHIKNRVISQIHNVQLDQGSYFDHIHHIYCFH